MQILIVALIVAGSAGYAVWTLMPAALRRPLAGVLLKVWLPGRLRQSMERTAASKAGGCGCDGCDHAGKPAAAPSSQPTAQPITFHPRARH